jgi:hypothetical protein
MRHGLASHRGHYPPKRARFQDGIRTQHTGDATAARHKQAYREATDRSHKPGSFDLHFCCKTTMRRQGQRLNAVLGGPPAISYPKWSYIQLRPGHATVIRKKDALQYRKTRN